MKTLIQSALGLASLALSALPVAPAHAQTFRSNQIQIGLLYPLSSNGMRAASDTNSVSINLLSGVSAQEEAFTFAGVTNVIRKDASGLQVAGFSNHVGERCEGVLFAGFRNTYAEGDGLQFAGFSNVAGKAISGGQFAGFLNRAGVVNGFQFAGFSNIAADVKGAQFSGFVNTCKGMDGSQFAGFANISQKTTHGSQFAGFINRGGNLDGSQLAGFINIAKKVKGTQIAGFINIADSSDNPLGIINIIRDGEKSFGISMDDNATTLLTFRSGGRNLYGVLGAGYNFYHRQNDLYALEAGFGGHLRLVNAVRINFEATTLALQTFKGGEYFKSSFRMLPAIKIAPMIELHGGPSFNWVNTNTEQGRGLTKKYLSTWTNNNNYFRAIYIGYQGGFHFLF